ncbi:hypothetical protein [Oscillibacter sp.]|nr:hypothetical protein [Oscillibacter sp.]
MPDHLSPNQGAPAKSKILWGDKFGFFAYYCWIAGTVTLVLTIIQ